MCGIVGFIGTFGGVEMVYEGIKMLQNRGYDSCGICSINSQNQLVWNKCANKKNQTAVQAVGDKLDLHKGNRVIIGHSRWATTGAITDPNAHPHFDNKNRLALVHNGIIENYQELKDFLLAKGYTFISETDTEVVAVLIGYYLDQDFKFMESLEKAIAQLHGTWGLAIITTETPNKLYLCKNGSPLVVGCDDNFALVASESSAVLNHVKNYFLLKNNEIICISLDNEGVGVGKTKITIEHNSKIIDEPEKIWSFMSTAKEIEEINKFVSGATPGSLIATTPAPYSHWMLKEIMEQPDSVFRAMNLGGRLIGEDAVRLGGLNEYKDELLKIKHLLVLGCGTSYHSALLGAKYFKLLESVAAIQVIDASEFSVKDIPRPYSDVGVLVLSQSGETKDVHRAMEIAKAHGIIVFSIVNVVGSLIARESSCGVYLNAGREVAVASTKAFTSQIVALALIAIWFAAEKGVSKAKRKELVSDLRRLPDDCRAALKQVDKQCDLMLPILKGQRSIFILGRDFAEPIAYEGALKIKEIAYLHAQGYPSGSLKHGPFALIEQGTPIMLIMLDDEHASKIEIAAEEVRARGASTILITNKNLASVNTRLFDTIATVADNRSFASLLTVLPLQYLAFKIAFNAGYALDTPRNLCKTVNVDG
jgi:glutamine---fructose-6-phosphate transaminase (isomerizing)